MGVLTQPLASAISAKPAACSQPVYRLVDFGRVTGMRLTWPIPKNPLREPE